MGRHYVSCPVCGARMHRTGAKTGDLREYKCPECGGFFDYSEQDNSVVQTALGYPMRDRKVLTLK